MKTAACYIRVSTEDQVDYSPESQLAEIQKYADNNGYVILEEFIFIDEGISGRNAQKRPQFNEMIKTAKIKPKPFEAVLLWKFSRFARNKTDAVVYKNLLRNQLGIEVISISENLGEDRGTAVILESMFEAMDEYYSINLSTEVKRSMTLKAEKGEPLCPAPFGYKNEDKKYVTDTEKAKWVRYMFDSFQKGKGFRTIASELHNYGVRTNRGNIPDSRFVEYILKNPVYTGKIRWSKNKNSPPIVADGNHQAIITESQFNCVQKIIEEQKAKYSKKQKTYSLNEWSLRGLVRCDKCGGTLVHTSLKDNSLQCHNYSRGKCKISHYITVKKITETVSDYLENSLGNIHLTIKPTDSKGENNVQMLKKMLEKENKKLIRAKEAYLNGIDSAEEYKNTKEIISLQIDSIKKQLQNNLNQNNTKETINTDLLSFLCCDKVSEKAKNEALRCIIYEIVLYKPENIIEIVLRD